MPPMMAPRGMMSGYTRMPMPHMGMMPPIAYPAQIPFASSSQPEMFLPTDKQSLGEILYPMIKRIDPENAPKITGMLLEMEVEVLHNILKNPSQIEGWVLKGKEVLNSSEDGYS